MATTPKHDPHIFAAEVYAVFAFLVEHGPALRGRDLIVFIDHEAGCSAIFRGSTKVPGIAPLVHAIHWFLTALDVRCWFEWIDTHSNPADGMSRDGVSDTWSISQGRELSTASSPS